MKLILDFFALILFFTTYYFTRDIYTATIVAIVAGIFQAAFIWFKYKKLETMQWVSLLLIMVFGGLTVFLHNDVFIKWKPSLLFWAMAIAVLGGILFKKNILKKLMGKELSLPETVWRNLSWAWVVFFTIMGIVNLWVAYHFDNDVWVTYKTFGSMGLMVAFFIGQGIYLVRYLPKNNG